ncbi:MAG: hypothetical protein IT514_05450 [Burkholderiales bacterium]|nr:hypothetical protein [Burkholderiales bacterium]
MREVIADATYRPMAEVAPLVRREVEIDREGSYPESGIRSFGKSTFHKPQLAGVEAGSKWLLRIEAGDLLSSNVFAWEGAIAVARPSISGVSVRTASSPVWQIAVWLAPTFCGIMF